MEYIVETKHLTKTFDKHKAVENVNLNIQKGEIYGFLGPNGAGKINNNSDVIRINVSNFR